MKKITKNKIEETLKKDSNYSIQYEKGDESKLYKKYKWLSFSDAMSELEAFVSDEGIYFDFYSENENKEEVKQKFEEFQVELPFGLEIVNEEVDSAFINHRSYEPMEETREKEYEVIEERLSLVVKKYSKYFCFKAN